jgi:hypothetical protein
MRTVQVAKTANATFLSFTVEPFRGE